VKSIQVQNGDISVNSGSLQFISGSQKLAQQLVLWLEEPMVGTPPVGIGYTTPSFGSVLSSYIGQADSSAMQTQVKTEILRILGLYQQNQYLQLQSAQTTASLSYWNKTEIIQQVLSVNVSQTNFTIIADVSIQTLANTTLAITIGVNQNGITVS
jgi:phage baseplate assembly protein W